MRAVTSRLRRNCQLLYVAKIDGEADADFSDGEGRDAWDDGYTSSESDSVGAEAEGEDGDSVGAWVARFAAHPEGQSDEEDDGEEAAVDGFGASTIVIDYSHTQKRARLE